MPATRVMDQEVVESAALPAETSRIDSRNCTRSRKNPGGVRPVHFRQFRPFRVPAERTVYARVCERDMLSNLAFLSEE